MRADYVLKTPRNLWALEVKSGAGAAPRGLEAVCKRYPGARPVIVGDGGMGLEEFFRSEPATLFP